MPGKQVEMLQTERQEILVEKRRCEAELNEIEAYKRDELHRIYKIRQPKTQQIVATNELEVSVRKKRAPILKQLNAIEERLVAIKRRVIEKTPPPPTTREDVQVLLRIENLLTQIVEKLNPEE